MGESAAKKGSSHREEHKVRGRLALGKCGGKKKRRDRGKATAEDLVRPSEP